MTMVNRNYKIVFVFMIIIFSFITFSITGCDDTGATTPLIPTPDCIRDLRLKFVGWRHFYMESRGGRDFSLLQKSTDMDNAFRYRCRAINNDTSMNGNIFGTSVSYRVINSIVSGNYNPGLALALHRDTIQSTYFNLGRHPYYTCGIDSLNYDAFSNRVGISSIGLGYSYIFVGKIARLEPTNFSNLNTAIITHELTHQIGINNEYHTGTDSIRCLMNESGISTTQTTPYLTFCDTHACTIYGRILELDQNNHKPICYEKRNAGAILSDTKAKFEQLNVNIELDKYTYIEGELIMLNIKFKNVSNENITIKSFNDDFINTNIIIKNSEGNLLNYLGLISTYLETANYTFCPGEEISHRIDVLDNFATSYIRYQAGSVNGLLTADKYYIQFKKRINEEQFIESNTLIFNVKEPIDKEKIAFDELIKIYSRDFKLDYNEKAESYREFIYKYSYSNYIDQAFKLMLALKGITSNLDEQTLDDCKWFVYNKSNSAVTKDAIECIIMILKSKERIEELTTLLEQIIEKLPNTKASEIAKTELKDNL